MRFKCTNPKHKHTIEFKTVQPKDRKGKKVLPACPGCRLTKFVKKVK